jgi:hypothetical protein
MSWMGACIMEKQAFMRVFVACYIHTELWNSALRQQIYLGDDAFVARMQHLMEPARIRLKGPGSHIF